MQNKQNKWINANHSRRKFIKKTLHMGVMLPILGTGMLSCQSSSQDGSKNSNNLDKKLNILILGGTSFLGPHQIAYAMERGHTISTFTRGKTMPTVHKDLFDKVESLIGDRENDLSALHNRKWDVVIDNSGRNVEWTRASAELLKESTDLYVYTSSTGVYYPYLGENFKEDYKVLLEEPEELEDEDQSLQYWYGVMKSNSELAAIHVFGADRSLIVRPTYMLGPADRTNRFIHWPIRLSKGGEVMVPGKSGDPVQYADVRDVASWMIRLIEDKKSGVYNAVGPRESQDIRDFVGEAAKAFDVNSNFVYIDDYEFLKSNDILYMVPWIMPEGNNIGTAKINNEKALANGLHLRPLGETMKDTLEWWNSDAVNSERKGKYLSDEASILSREIEILRKWEEMLVK